MTNLLMNLSKEKLKWFRAALVITGAIKGTFRDSLYQELSLESLEDRRWSRRLFSSTKLYRDSYHPTFILTIMLIRSTTQNEINPISARTKVFENSFFPYCIKEWSKLNNKIRNIKSINLK